jgi:ankyrin repeat protein
MHARLLVMGFLLCLISTSHAADEKVTIWQAAETGDVETVKKHLAAGVAADAPDPEKKCTPLTYASYSGHAEVVKVLLDAGAQVNKRSPAGHPHLCFAAQNGHVDTVKLLLARGADIEAFNTDYFRPLGMAAFNGHHEVIKVLLAAGAKVNGTNQPGSTALMAAAEKGDVKAMEILLTARADTEISNDYGVTAAFYAAMGNHLDALKLLAKHGGNVKFNNGDASTIGAAASRGHTAVTLYLIDQGMDVNIKGRGDTPLSLACANGHVQLMRELVKRGAEFDEDDDGLVDAIKNGHAEAASYAVDLDATIYRRDRKELTE